MPERHSSPLHPWLLEERIPHCERNRPLRKSRRADATAARHLQLRDPRATLHAQQLARTSLVRVNRSWSAPPLLWDRVASA